MTGEERTEAATARPSLNEEAVERANQRFHNDPDFHARVTVAERAARQRLEAGGMRISRSYLVAIRMGAMLGLFAAEVDVQ